MDDSQYNGSSSRDNRYGWVESLFSSSDDPSYYLSPSLQDLEIVESILEMLENGAPSPEMKAAELAMDPISPPPGDSSGDVLLEKVENDEEIAPEDGSSDISKDQNSTEASSANNNHHVQHPPTLSSPSSPSLVIDEPEPVEPAHQDPVALQMKELVYYASLFGPMTTLGPEKDVEEEKKKKKKRKRKNAKTSSKADPPTTTAASRNRREKISENIRVLQGLVPGGNKMDITTLLDEVISYLMFLDKYVKTAERLSDKDIASKDFPPTRRFSPF